MLTCRNGSEPASLQAPGRATVQPQKAQGKGFFTILRNSATEKAAGSPTAARRTDLAPQNSTLGGPRGFAGTPPRPRFFVASRDTVLLRQALTVRRDIRPPCAGLKPLPTCTPRLLPRGSPLAEPSAPGAVGLTPSVLHSAALGTPAIGFVELVDVVEEVLAGLGCGQMMQQGHTARRPSCPRRPPLSNPASRSWHLNHLKNRTQASLNSQEGNSQGAGCLANSVPRKAARSRSTIKPLQILTAETSSERAQLP